MGLEEKFTAIRKGLLEFLVLKVISGCPISMEGKSATCAHFSPLGNIASAVCDLWSNESVQNVRLLSGNAPEAFAELLIYDCRLMNTAAERGGAGEQQRDASNNQVCFHGIVFIYYHIYRISSIRRMRRPPLDKEITAPRKIIP